MALKVKRVGVALVGCGVVGGATATLLTRDRELLGARTGLQLDLLHIVDKDFGRAELAGLDRRLFRTELGTALADPAVAVVLELAGGTGFARDVIRKSLEAGKHVVTANKALLAHHGRELFELARRKGLSISFEASCGGGIPIIRALYDGLIANRIDALYGIVNGTCNHILTQMTQAGRTYADVLAEAQGAGLAEADPALDVSGMDSAHKLTIMAGLAFGVGVELSAVPVEGIDKLEPADVAFGKELGYVVKLLAIAQRLEGGVCLRVRPSFISREHPLAWVSGPFNAVSVYGHATGHTMYYGRGAGGSPTASAIIADIVSAASGVAGLFRDTVRVWPELHEPRVLVPEDELELRAYLRLMVDDHPGVLAQITAVLARHRISISSVLQKEMPEKSADPALAPVVIVTHATRQGDLRAAVAELAGLEPVRRPPMLINIIDEHEEGF
jgi:homoserine dehydrogenase